ncbi:Predicted ATPase or kinase [Prochlorococcus marinus str. MIT 9215]|uniref:tRNA threonylcarbamoyladenosine biosynthesis protein TsaE n=1 Tax=Prochlorococcus marinus (strain MIT 9215) TaxID=93060 RepID=A8G7D2_PROM2|nr:Predicted ATPase or kinase [Prochlorococcus marinus str. MIT 9215]
MYDFVFVENLKETLNLGEKLSQKLNPQSIVLLKGPIGAGKTSFVQGIAKGLSISENITSPTFALSHHYSSGKIPLIHLDLYRLENSSAAKEVFFSEEEEAIQRKAILVIEWPELIEAVIDNFWKIEISYAKKDGRHYEIRDPKNLLTFS